MRTSALVIALFVLAAQAEIVDKYTSTVNFEKLPTNLGMVNNSLIYNDKYGMMTGNGTLFEITDDSCDTSYPYFYSTNGNVYCVTDEDSNYNQIFLQTNGDKKAKWVKNQTISLNAGDLDPRQALSTMDIAYTWSASSEDIVIFNFTTKKFGYSNDDFPCDKSDYDESCSQSIAVSDKGIAYATYNLSSPTYSVSLKYYDFNTSKVYNFTQFNISYESSGSYSGTTSVTFLNNSMAAAYLTSYTNTSGSIIYRLDTVAWDASFKPSVGTPTFYRSNPPPVMYAWSDNTFVLASQSNSSSSQPWVGKYVIDTTGNLTQLAKLPNYFAASVAAYNDDEDDTIDQASNFINDGQGNLMVFYPKAQISIYYSSFYYSDIHQYMDYQIAPALYLNNGTKIIPTPYGLGSFDGSGKLSGHYNFYLDSFFYDAVTNGYFFLQEDDKAKLISLNANTNELNLYQYSFDSTCGTSERAYILGVWVKDPKDRPDFVYTCNDKPGTADYEIYIIDGSATSDDQQVSTDLDSRQDQIIFFNNNATNVSALSITGGVFSFTNYKAGEDDGSSGLQLKDATAAAKVDETTVIYATTSKDATKSIVSIRDLNNTFLFNETVDKAGIQSIIPLGYIGDNIPSKILGFLFVDSQDWSMWFYNIQDKDKLIQTGFGSQEYEYRYAGNGTSVWNSTSGLQLVYYFNLTDFGLASAGIMSLVTVLMMIAMMMLMF